MKKQLLLAAIMLGGVSTLTAQVRMANGNVIAAASNSSAFFDAGSTPTWNSSTNVGKGMIFPRVQLSQFTSFSIAGTVISNNYPTRFDGFIVYNTDESGVAGVGSTQGTLSRGFWYYDNPNGSGSGGSFTTGTWRPLFAGGTGVGDALVGNEILDVVPNKGLERTGSGTAADPFKIQVVDGSATGQILQWNGNSWVAATNPGLTTEVDGLIGNEIVDVVANKGLIRTGTGTSTDPYKVAVIDGTAVGQTLKWNGNAWIAAADAGLTAEVDGIVGNEIVDVVANKGLIRTGAGTTSDPYKVAVIDGTAAGQTLKWNGSSWTAAADAGLTAEIDGAIGNEVTDVTLNGGLVRAGSGSSTSPYTLGLTTAGAQVGQSMVWNGTSWVIGNPTSSAVKNVSNHTGSYTVTNNDDILIYNGSSGGQTLTLPSTGITVGKIIYILNTGNQDWQLSPAPINSGIVVAMAQVGTTLIYAGSGQWGTLVGY
jgi:hypothetical protein